jgi:hypothetical protein
MLKFYRTISILMAVIFLATTTATWPASGSFLRQCAALERNGGFELGQRENIYPGIDKTDLRFCKEGKFAKGRLVILNPRMTVIKQEFYHEVADYNFYQNAVTPELAEKMSRQKGRQVSFRPVPGKTVAAFLAQTKSDVKFATNTSQGHFWDANSFHIIDRKIRHKTAPGIGVEQDVVPLLNGTFYLFVIDGAKLGIRIVTMVNGVPREDISDIKEAIAGPPLVLGGKKEVRIEQAAPPLTGVQVVWDPEKVTGALSALGLDKDGNLMFMSLAGDSDVAEEISVYELADAMMLAGAQEAVLMGGSVDIQQFLKGDQPEFVVGRPHKYSSTGRFFEEHGGRPLGAILYVTLRQEEFAFSETRINIEGKFKEQKVIVQEI